MFKYYASPLGGGLRQNADTADDGVGTDKTLTLLILGSEEVEPPGLRAKIKIK